MDSPTMFDTNVAFAGITLHVDPINRDRTDTADNVMAMFHEEQPLTWEVIHPSLEDALKRSRGDIGFLDVGTGSGVFAILVKKNYGNVPVLAIDKSDRAIAFAKSNALANDVAIGFRKETYGYQTARPGSCRAIGIYPPYHLYPNDEDIALKIPQHARGGSDGQREFISQLHYASLHLSKEGILFFNQMCWGDDEGPDFLRYIPRIFPTASFTWCNVFPRISTREFLEGVYAGRTEPTYRRYIEESTQLHPWLYYTVGIITNDDKGEIKEASHQVDLKGRSWKDRIVLHREIAAHAWK
ncbi:MAG TPA: methyltransferase [Patescibacteria group bacterium]